MDSVKDFNHRQILLGKMKCAEFGFKRAKEQVDLLDRKIRDTEIRYHRAVEAERKSFRYVLRQRLLVIERVRQYYEEFATRKADEIRIVWRQLFGRITDEMFEETREMDESGESDSDSEMSGVEELL
ncbi:hypothetical protein SNE40_004565 [Patella caerulea]|uniref:Uncharacterized protein n=1 Tax=Patella caerulea TaxID=87958 RepID=A0AAN8JYC6_PATCE